MPIELCQAWKRSVSAGLQSGPPSQRWKNGYAGLPVNQHDIDFLQPRNGFPQRACRQQGTIAETPASVDNGDLHIPVEPIVLKPVVRHQDVGTQINRHLCCSNPIGMNDDWTLALPRKHDGFITDSADVTIFSRL